MPYTVLVSKVYTCDINNSKDLVIVDAIAKMLGGVKTKLISSPLTKENSDVVYKGGIDI